MSLWLDILPCQWWKTLKRSWKASNPGGALQYGTKFSRCHLGLDLSLQTSPEKSSIQMPSSEIFPLAASGLHLCSPLVLHLPDLGMPQIVKDEAKPERKSYLHLNHTNVDISLISHTYCRKLEFFLVQDKIKYTPAYTERIRMCQLLLKHLTCLKSG